MSKIKLNSHVQEEDFNVIPDASKMAEETKEEKESFIEVKTEEPEQRKLFANKKANIALIVVGIILAALIIGAAVLAFI